MATSLRTIRLAAVALGIGLAMASPAKTPDGKTPSQETVCKGQPKSLKGLCNAYCEAMDCDTGPRAAQAACKAVLRNYHRRSDGADPPCLVAPGCADGEREGFIDESLYPDIAACAGGWSLAGVLGTSPAPACGLEGGDDGPIPDGSGCNVADLCALGWHVCASEAELAALSPTGCEGAADPGTSLLYTLRQSSNGCNVCATGTSMGACCDAATCCAGCAQTEATANDVYGCGTLGDAIASLDCGVIDRASGNLCLALTAPWSCPFSDSMDEAHRVIKPGSAGGGVLCCRDGAFFTSLVAM